MPRKTPEGVAAIISAFVTELTAAIESELSARVQRVVVAALGGSARRGPGRPRKDDFLVSRAAAVAGTRVRPQPLCPVPGCRNVAAPVFGMVCRDHKDVPKSMIKTYREARKLKTGVNLGVLKAAAVRRPRSAARTQKAAPAAAEKAAGTA
jgi:hypothetical protein